MQVGKGIGLSAAVQWAAARVREPSTWAGLAMIFIVFGSDPMRAHGVAEAISLIVGGGLVARPSATGGVGEGN